MQLVINTFGASLRRKGDRFLVRANDREIGLSAHKVQGWASRLEALLRSSAHFPNRQSSRFQSNRSQICGVGVTQGVADNSVVGVVVGEG